MNADDYAKLAALGFELIAKVIDEVRSAGTKTTPQQVFDKLTAAHAALSSQRAAEDAELHAPLDTGAAP